jgi:SAM-dependent methyltransferase
MTSASPVPLLLSDAARRKLDESSDTLFYDQPRFVTHVDEGFVARLTQLYRERLAPGTRILDLMSSWVSHLPPEMAFAHVEGHGLNGEELARNPRLDHAFVQDLNEQPDLPLPDQSFDAVLNAVAIQYLQQPERVLREVHRILKPGGQVIISFSNRMFFHKAIAAWRDNTEAGRVALVKRYLEGVGGFTAPEVIHHRPAALLGFSGGDPFYAVLARRLPQAGLSTR